MPVGHIINTYVILILESQWCIGLQDCVQYKRFKVRLPAKVKIVLLKYYRRSLRIRLKWIS